MIIPASYLKLRKSIAKKNKVKKNSNVKKKTRCRVIVTKITYQKVSVFIEGSSKDEIRQRALEKAAILEFPPPYGHPVYETDITRITESLK